MCVGLLVQIPIYITLPGPGKLNHPNEGIMRAPKHRYKLVIKVDVCCSQG